MTLWLLPMARVKCTLYLAPIILREFLKNAVYYNFLKIINRVVGKFTIPP